MQAKKSQYYLLTIGTNIKITFIIRLLKIFRSLFASFNFQPLNNYNIFFNVSQMYLTSEFFNSGNIGNENTSLAIFSAIGKSPFL